MIVLGSLLALAMTSRVTATVINATYDSLKATPILPEAAPLQIYDGLNYESSWTVTRPLLTTGIEPASPPHYISTTSLVQQIAQGQITVNGTTSKSFAIQQLYFGCSLNLEQDLVSLATNCSMRVAGYAKVGAPTPVYYEDFFYEGSKLVNKMQSAVLSAANAGTQIEEAIIFVSGSNAEPNGPYETVLFVDNLVYDLMV